jgi:hypothetical protein
MSIIIDGTGTISGVSSTGLTTAQTVTQSAIATGVAGTGPAFSYYQSSAQTLTGGTNTKLTFTTADFDTTGGMYSSSRFTPTVAGYYQVNAAFIVGASYTTAQCAIYKNGSSFKIGAENYGSLSGTSNGWAVNGLVYCNGSTDYIEIYAVIANGQALLAGSPNTYFQASMVRAA